MGKIKPKFICGCGAKYETGRGLSLHKTHTQHWIWPKTTPPPPPPSKKHVSFIDIFEENMSWGKEMTDNEKSHPSDHNLHMGILIAIFKTLKEIENELKCKF